MQSCFELKEKHNRQYDYSYYLYYLLLLIFGFGLVFKQLIIFSLCALWFD